MPRFTRPGVPWSVRGRKTGEAHNSFYSFVKSPQRYISPSLRSLSKDLHAMI